MFLNEVMQETSKICTTENGPIWATPEYLPFLKKKFINFFLFLRIKSTKMKVRQYFTMEKVQKLTENTWKYLIYKPWP